MTDGELRKLAREEPQAVRNVAERADNQFGEWLLRIVEEESGGGDE